MNVIVQSKKVSPQLTYILGEEFTTLGKIFHTIEIGKTVMLTNFVQCLAEWGITGTNKDTVNDAIRKHIFSQIPGINAVIVCNDTIPGYENPIVFLSVEKSQKQAQFDAIFALVQEFELLEIDSNKDTTTNSWLSDITSCTVFHLLKSTSFY